VVSDQVGLREPLGDHLGRAVAGRVVDDDQLGVEPSGRGTDCRQAARELLTAVVAHDDNGEVEGLRHGATMIERR
jgi:hypothetical protein